MKLVVRAVTDRGLKRPRNEDSHGVWMPEAPDERRRRGVLLVIADGMGGARAGDEASRLAVETALAAYREAPGGDVAWELSAAVAAANRVLYEINTSSGERPMATTLTAAVVRGSDLVLAHVGDTRAYVLRGGRLAQITADHSLVAKLVAMGELTADEARVDPRRNLLTRSVGVRPEVEVDGGPSGWVLAPGDVLVLSSDGLHGLVRDQEIAAAIDRAANLEAALAELVALALGAGGSDNITVILARAETEGEA